MKIISQVGHGKSDYVTQCLADGNIVGAIFSPRDETPDEVRRALRSIYRDERVEFAAFDPQFYAFTLPDARLRNLDIYPYCPGFLTRRQFSQLDRLREFSVDAIDYQLKLSVTHLIAPAIQLIDLRDSYSQIYMTMAQESIEYWKRRSTDKSLLISLILNESALSSSEAVDEFLDVITSWEYDGVYICVESRTGQYPQRLSAQALTNLLYIVYVLSELNDKQVIFGYSDFIGILVGAAGAHYLATGWYNSLKSFSLTRFIPRKGGGRARQRYASVPLLASVLVEPELSEILDLGYSEYALSGTSFDVRIAESPGTAWTASISYREHAAALASLAASVTNAGRTPAARMKAMARRISRAQSAVQLLTSEGVVFETRFGFLEDWQSAIDEFLERIVW
jgi:hypothetical protein